MTSKRPDSPVRIQAGGTTFWLDATQERVVVAVPGLPGVALPVADVMEFVDKLRLSQSQAAEMAPYREIAEAWTV